MNRTTRLCELADLVRKEFPAYQYQNGMDPEFTDKHLLSRDYTILIRGVSPNDANKVWEFITEKVLRPCAEAEEEELPIFVVLEERV
jgi:hypothetical protein